MAKLRSFSNIGIKSFRWYIVKTYSFTAVKIMFVRWIDSLHSQLRQWRHVNHSIRSFVEQMVDKCMAKRKLIVSSTYLRLLRWKRKLSFLGLQNRFCEYRIHHVGAEEPSHYRWGTSAGGRERRFLQACTRFRCRYIEIQIFSI